MPKSSSEKPTPWACRALILVTASWGLSRSTLSVSSSFRRCAGAPLRSSVRSTWATKSLWRSCLPLTFTDKVRCAHSGLCAHCASCWQAVSSTHWPSGKISPVSSARPMKSRGDTSPRSGCCQRTSPSVPMMRPVPSTWGWWYRRSCCSCSAVRRSCSSARRCTTAACISGSKKRTVLRPASLAWYMARSACFIRSSALASSPTNSTTPMLHELCMAWPARAMGEARACSILCATPSAWVAAWWDWALKPSRMTTNSSPPRRATVSPSRTAATRRWPISLSSKSPCSWPRLSLTSLKLSRSMNISAPCSRVRRPLCSACSSRSSSRRRLGRRVSGS